MTCSTRVCRHGAVLSPHTKHSLSRRVVFGRSGLVRHELALVDIDYRKAIDEATPKTKTSLGAKTTKLEAFKPPLPSTILVHYIDPAVETDTDILPFVAPASANPLARLRHKRREMSPEHTGSGVSSQFRSQEDVEADMTSAQGQATHQAVPELSLPPPSVHLEEEEQRMTDEIFAFFDTL